MCLLDTTSGASISIREQLHQLVGRGIELRVLGATIFDDARGRLRIASEIAGGQMGKAAVVQIGDGPIQHFLVITGSHARRSLTSLEEDVFYRHYKETLRTFKPDLVYFYGGRVLEMMLANEARIRGIPTAAYMANADYKGAAWCRDVDLLVTDSNATAELYRRRLGVQVHPVGLFINPERTRPARMTRENVLFVNPAFSKGAAIVAALAILLEEKRTDIRFEVVESRGDWPSVVQMVKDAWHTIHPRVGFAQLRNVRVTPHSADMRPVYGRARILLAPSLCWESAGRVNAEAMCNGIPAIVSNHGGAPEMIEDGGVRVTFHREYHQKPWRRVPNPPDLQFLVDVVQRFYDDREFYGELCERARAVADRKHSLERNTNCLLDTLLPLLSRCAGDLDQNTRLREHHKHGSMIDL